MGPEKRKDEDRALKSSSHMVGVGTTGTAMRLPRGPQGRREEQRGTGTQRRGCLEEKRR